MPPNNALKNIPFIINLGRLTRNAQTSSTAVLFFSERGHTILHRIKHRILVQFAAAPLDGDFSGVLSIYEFNLKNILVFHSKPKFQ